MARVSWTRTAEAELEDIVYFIAVKDRRRETATKIFHEVKDKCQLYAKNPELGLARPDLCRQPEDAYRSFTFKRWVVIYEPREYGIEILAIFDGSRRYESFFQRPED
jgi:toxin ParE1/3/4